MTKPFVSVITPTYNRARFIPRIIECYAEQTYPHENMEWIILDDGTDRTEDFFNNCGLPNVRWYSCEKAPMGEKLNRLIEYARGDIVVVMDDDDYYPPERVSSVVEAFEANPTIELAGSSQVYMYYADTAKIYSAGPYMDTHALNCTLAWRASYTKTHRYDPTEGCAVEHGFLDDFTQPMIQLNPFYTILHIIHKSNTFDRANHKKIGLVKKTDMKLADFIENTEILEQFLGSQ